MAAATAQVVAPSDGRCLARAALCVGGGCRSTVWDQWPVVAGTPASGNDDDAALTKLVAPPPKTMKGGGGAAVAGMKAMAAPVVALMALAVAGDAIYGGLGLEQAARAPRVWLCRGAPAAAGRSGEPMATPPPSRGSRFRWRQAGGCYSAVPNGRYLDESTSTRRCVTAVATRSDGNEGASVHAQLPAASPELCDTVGGKGVGTASP